MSNAKSRLRLAVLLLALTLSAPTMLPAAAQAKTPKAAPGDERAVPRHLLNGQELSLSLDELVAFGRQLFTSNWTDQDGAGRPLGKGTGDRLSESSRPLVGFRGMNRVSGPDANSCVGCHNMPLFTPGGSGDVTTVVFQQAQRFDFVTFDRKDGTRTGGSLNEAGRPVSLHTVGNLRSTPGLFGAGYIEMLGRQTTSDLQRIRDAMAPGQTRALVSKGISFGKLTRRRDGNWDTSAVEGLPCQSLALPPQGAGSSAALAPSLVVRPWQRSGTSVSLRELTNTSLNQHHGIQSSERFGVGTDPDGDGVVNEITRGDVTALTAFVATLPVPGRVIPDDPELKRAVMTGEKLFDRIGCTMCHVPALPIDRNGWIYTEPGPYNTQGNLQRGSGARLLEVDLTNPALPQPRLAPSRDNPGTVLVPAYTDLKLHDITDPADEAAQEPIDLNQPPGSRAFLGGNRKLLTRRLWDAGNGPTYFHHGLLTTIREAVIAHAGEALEQRRAFEALPRENQDAVIEFLKSLQVSKPSAAATAVRDTRPQAGTR